MFADKNKIFTVKGHVIDQKTRKGVKGLRVEVWDKDKVTKNDYLNSAITDEEGFFQLSSDNSRFIEFIFDRKPDFYFRVYSGEQFIISTESKIYWNVSQPNFELQEPITINSECMPSSNNLIYRVFGTVHDANNNTASIRYTVRAFARDNLQKETQLGSTLTDEGDFYQIEFSQSAFREIDSARSNPNLFVRVYNDKNEKIGESVLIENAGLVTELDIDITLFRVHGNVTDSNGKFVKNNTVKVFDRDLRHLELLGITKTDAKGSYEITYNKQKFSRAEKETADIEVHVGDGDKITKSEIHFNAPADTVINLVVPIAETQLSEFELLLKVIYPLLKGQGENGNDLAIESLQLQDAEFLGKDTGEPIERINWLITATKISQDFVVDTKKEVDSSSNETSSTRIPPAIFYAWMRKGLPDKLEALQQETPTALRRNLLEAIDELLISATYKEQVESYIALLGHPQWAEVKEFITAALTIDLDKRILLSQQIDSLDAIQDLLLTGLVQSKVLTDEESNQVGLAVSLHRLIRGPVNKLPRLLEVKPAKLGRPLAKSEDLARLDLSDWENLIALSEVAIPTNQSVREYARNLEEIAVNTYPTIGLLYRSSRISDSLDSSFNSIKPKLSALKKLGKSFCSICDSDTTTSDPLARLWELSINDPEFSEIASSLSSKQRQAVGEIQNHVRMHPGIDSNVPLGELQELCKHWGSNLNELIRINPDKDLLASDLSVFAAKQPDVHFADLPREPLLRELTSMQRMLVLAETPTKAQALMQAGLYSATQMALLPRSALREKIKLSELSDSEINKLHERAITQANKNAIGYFAAKNEMQSFRMFGKAARAEETQQFDEVQKLFGNLDACECAHCLSVLSPSAYFVDLMYYIERYITAPQDPKLSLKVRRADLWDLPLNCDSTNTIVPTLDIVNRILENWLKPVLQADPPIDPTIEIFNRIAAPGTIDRFNLPVNFPLQRLEILLAHFGLSRDRISRVVGWDKSSQRIQTRLQLTADEISIVTQPRTTTMSSDVREFFVKLYDIHSALLSSSNADAVIDERETDLSHFQHVTKLERNVLRKLILCQFVSNDGSNNGSVKVVMRTAPGDVQNNIESIQNLSLKRLDRLHRMIRLWRKLPWTVDELDYVITRLAKDRDLVSPELTAEIVGDIVNILDLADRTELPVDELLSLVSAIPDIGLKGDDSLFTRRFNTEPFVTRDDLWPNELPAELKHPAFSPEGASEPDKNMLLRLLAALQLDDPQFLQLVQGLEALPVDDQGNTLLSLKNQGASNESRVIKVTLKSLHFLYRYARFAHLLGVKIPELLRLVRLALKIDNTTPNNVFIQSISDVFTVIKFADVQKTSGYALDEIEWLLESKTPSGTRSASDIAAAVISQIAQERLLVISATTLTAIGLTELESTETLKQLNQSILDASDQEGEYRFKPSINYEQISENINTKLSATLDFDVATTAILSYAAHLGEFEDIAFKKLYLEESDSKEIVANNLASVAGDVNKAFELIDPNANPLLYRLNPSFEQNRITLDSDIADKMILNFADKLRKNQSTVILETVFQEIYLSAQQSRWLVMANTATSATSQSSLFIKNPGGNGLIINPEFNTTLPSPNPGKLEFDKLVTRQLTTLLERYHWSHAFDQTVASELSVEPGRIAAFRSYVTLASNIPEILLGLKSDADQSLFKWIADAQRLQCLVKDPIFDTAAVQEILSYWPSLKTTPSPDKLWNQVLATTAYARWLKAVLESSEKAEVRRTSLENIRHTATTEKIKKEDVANVLGVPVETIRSATKIEPAPAEWFQQLEQWSLIVEIITRLGVSGETLYRMFPLSKAGEEVHNLWRAADDIHGAFRAKYQDDASYQKKAEAFEDVIRGKRRDALVTFLLETKDFEFKRTSDLYAYFLMDTEIGGCARTSELVAATSSLQLYVHRVLMGLEYSKEQSKPSEPSEKIAFNDARKRQEWSWRKHYRVWEANRKVFLFPENFIEPDLRDDKTPLFLDLENELLQQQITTPEAEQSYFKYLTGFNEVSSLKIVGAFHDNGKDSETHIEKDILHLVGVTENDPPVHYLRQINNYKSSRTDKGRPLQYGPWKKLEAQIPVKWVSPVVYQRKLMLFWAEITTVSTTRKIDSDSYFDGYEHKFKVKYIEQRPDGSWSAAQQLDFLDKASESKRSIQDNLEFIESPPADGASQVYGKVREDSGEFRFFTNNEGPIPLILAEPLYPYLLKQIKKNIPETVISLGNTDQKIKFKAIPTRQITKQYEQTAHHSQPLESYTLRNWNWERVFPTVRITQNDGNETVETLQIAAMNSDIHGFMPPLGKRIPFIFYKDIVDKNGGLLPAHITDSFSIFELSNQLLSSLSTTIAPVGHHTWKATEYLYSARPSKTVSQLPPGTTSVTRFSDPISDSLIVNAPAKVSVSDSDIAPYRADAIIHAGKFQVLATTAINLVLLSSILPSEILKQLGMGSVPGILNIKFQNSLNEINPVRTYNISPGFGKGAFGTYVRETFFHIPFLIANHLNSQQRFSDAQQWYHYIFNPMDANGNTWQYREFNTLTVETMRSMLTNQEALEAYRQNPFNPDAIARTRLSAYQKSIVMKYIDNLLDWGDRLFTQFTMESVNEATMLYILASDILGERPAQLPRCMEEKTRTYAQIKPSLSNVSDFLIEEVNAVELTMSYWYGALNWNLAGGGWPRVIAGSSIGQKNAVPLRSKPAQSTSTEADLIAADSNLNSDLSMRGTIWTSTGGKSLSEISLGNDALSPELTTIGADSSRLIEGNIDFGRERYQSDIFATAISGLQSINESITGEIILDDSNPLPYAAAYASESQQTDTAELISARNVFCFPQNTELLAYWNRVEDRLSKIRNCKDISGLRRQLDLFAPEIDPRELIRMRAAGLSLDDVMDITTGHAPPYRFVFLLEKARQYASTAQNLGNQLLAALEKRDGEELAAMRAVHEHRLLEMRKQLMSWERDASEDTLEGLNRQKAAIEYRKEHYEELLSGGLSQTESVQIQMNERSLTIGAFATQHEMLAAVLSIIPQFHAGPMPSTETGGRDWAKVLSHGAAAFRSLASYFSQAGQNAGLMSNFFRRDEEWKHQIALATHDLTQINKQIEAAEIRVKIAERSLEVHEKSIAQAQEVYDFYRNKFSKLGLYTWMSTQLHRMHRLAFNSAWSLARMVEKALHFERPDLRDTAFLKPSPWDAGNAGLLSGESLLLDLQRLEMRYLETNYRELEIEQSFSLALLDPRKLLDLQKNGECEFSVPEFFFDLYYPGQYRRRIKAIRLTIPCVVGPYSNVGATLTLLRSELRDLPQADGPLKTIPLRYAPTIAASNAQNDAGIFEFNFRDERYMPFEGMGAISTWKLTLPKQVRSFDYKTISDVILRINYTALFDEELRSEIDKATGKILESFKKAAPSRLISVRHEFPTIWSQFKTTQPNSSDRCELTLNIESGDYPFWISSFIKNGFNANLIIDHDSLEKEKDISVYEMSSPPKIGSSEPVSEEKDIIHIPADGKTYHEGLLDKTKPQAAIGKWTIYFDSKDRDLINDLWLKISW